MLLDENCRVLVILLRDAGRAILMAAVRSQTLKHSFFFVVGTTNGDTIWKAMKAFSREKELDILIVSASLVDTRIASHVVCADERRGSSRAMVQSAHGTSNQEEEWMSTACQYPIQYRYIVCTVGSRAGTRTTYHTVPKGLLTSD